MPLLGGRPMNAPTDEQKNWYLFISCLHTIRLANTVRRYIWIHNFNHIKKYVIEQKHSSMRASNERPYWIVKTITMLRSGIMCFFALQTIYTNWVRRLAVRADDIRPYRVCSFIEFCSYKWFAKQINMNTVGNVKFVLRKTFFPTKIFNFPFSIFH